MPLPSNETPLQPRELAERCFKAGWGMKDLVEAVAVCLSESAGYVGAWNDNVRELSGTEGFVREWVDDPSSPNASAGDVIHEADRKHYPPETRVITSRDIGLFQINVPATVIGTSEEERLYAVDANLDHAFSMFARRGWQPWYGFTNGYATSTVWWHFSAVKGEWVRTGRYLHKAIVGAGNFQAARYLLEPVPFLDFYRVPDKPTVPPPSSLRSLVDLDERGLLRGDGVEHDAVDETGRG